MLLQTIPFKEYLSRLAVILHHLDTRKHKGISFWKDKTLFPLDYIVITQGMTMGMTILFLLLKNSLMMQVSLQ